VADRPHDPAAANVAQEASCAATDVREAEVHRGTRVTIEQGTRNTVSYLVPPVEVLDVGETPIVFGRHLVRFGVHCGVLRAPSTSLASDTPS